MGKVIPFPKKSAVAVVDQDEGPIAELMALPGIRARIERICAARGAEAALAYARWHAGRYRDPEAYRRLMMTRQVLKDTR